MKRLGSLPKLVAILAVVVALVTILGSCAPRTGAALNSLTGDEATLYLLAGEGIQFDPGERTAFGVLVDVIADELTAYPADLCTPDDLGLDCDLGDVASPVLLEISGSAVSATATYRRSGAARIYQEVARVP